MQKHFLLLLFSEQGGADCGGPLSAAAQTHRICPETDERFGPEMEGQGENVSPCYGEKYGLAVLTMEERPLIFKRLSGESYKVFRDKQFSLLRVILKSFEIETYTEQLK